MKRPGIEELRNSGLFRPVLCLPFSGILTFVFENIRQRNFYTVLYAVINVIGLAALIAISFIAFTKDHPGFGSYMSSLGWGTLAGSILIIPFHEGLHAAGFLLIGARKIKFGADLSQAIFYATAKDFVAGRKGFTMVALAPFAGINLAGMVFIFGGNTTTQLIVITTLFLHNIMCIGDFAMLSFFIKHRNKEMYTFDETETMTAWFYERIKD
jgi:hypothetical protein